MEGAMNYFVILLSSSFITLWQIGGADAALAVDSGTQNNDIVCMRTDVLDVASRMESLESKYALYTEDRQQMFSYFQVITEMMKRQIQMEQTNDLLQQSVLELQSRKDEMAQEIQNMKRNLELLTTEMDTLKEENGQRLTDVSVEINETKTSITNQVAGLTARQEEDRAMFSNQVQRLADDMAGLTVRQEEGKRIFSNQIESLTDVITLNLTRLTIKPVGFTARRIPGVGDTDNNSIVLFNRVYLNEGNGFNADNGKFHCREPGLYYFSSSVETQVTRADFSILKNGQEVGNFLKGSAPNVWGTGSVSIVVRLSVGDEVWVRNKQGSGLGQISWFSGVLISK